MATGYKLLATGKIPAGHVVMYMAFSQKPVARGLFSQLIAQSSRLILVDLHHKHIVFPAFYLLYAA